MLENTEFCSGELLEPHEHFISTEKVKIGPGIGSVSSNKAKPSVS